VRRERARRAAAAALRRGVRTHLGEVAAQELVDLREEHAVGDELALLADAVRCGRGREGRREGRRGGRGEERRGRGKES